VIRLYEGVDLRRELRENCFRDLISSGAYSYGRFMEEFDRGLRDAGLKPAVSHDERLRITDLLWESENSILARRIDAQRSEYRELMSKYIALQVQYMEQQDQFQRLINQHQQYATTWKLAKAMLSRVFRGSSRTS